MVSDIWPRVIATDEAAYIEFVPLLPGGVAESIPAVLPEADGNAAGSIVLDFDAQHRLVGIEILDPQRWLPEAVLREAEVR